jgi:hypothetical protein
MLSFVRTSLKEGVEEKYAPHRTLMSVIHQKFTEL